MSTKALFGRMAVGGTLGGLIGYVYPTGLKKKKNEYVSQVRKDETNLIIKGNKKMSKVEMWQRNMIEFDKNNALTKN